MEPSYTENGAYGILHEKDDGELRWMCIQPYCFGDFHWTDETRIEAHVHGHEIPTDGNTVDTIVGDVLYPSAQVLLGVNKAQNRTSSGPRRCGPRRSGPRRSFILDRSHGHMIQDEEGHQKWLCAYCGVKLSEELRGIQTHLRRIHGILMTAYGPRPSAIQVANDAVNTVRQVGCPAVDESGSSVDVGGLEGMESVAPPNQNRA